MRTPPIGAFATLIENNILQSEMIYTTDNLFKQHFPKHSNAPLIALGMLQWGTTPIDHRLINGYRGVLTEKEATEIYNTFRSRGVVLFDTAEGYGGGSSEKRLGRLWQSETKLIKATSVKPNVILMTKFLPVPWRWTHHHFERALRDSNARMGISACPIYLLHSPMHLTREIEYWVESAGMLYIPTHILHFWMSIQNQRIVQPF